MLIGTNGRRTERDYLRGLTKESRAVRVGHVWFDNSSPSELVLAVERKADRDEYDSAWVVVDLDDEHQPDEIGASAADAGVELIWSVPSFEVWLIMHFENCTAHIESAGKCHVKLERHLGSWDKSRLDFKKFSRTVDDAVRRAKNGGTPPHDNPSTAMWRLVEALHSVPDDDAR
jgi:hypothetical protein